MKPILLPLITATSILTVLAPRADAAAITTNHASLSPRLISAGKLQRRYNQGLPASIFKTPAAVSASTASIEEFLANAISSGALITSGAGTLILNSAHNYFGGEIGIGSGTLVLDTTGGGIALTGGNLNLSIGTVNITGSWNLTIGGSIGILTGDALLFSGGLSGTIVTGSNGTLTVNGGALTLGNNNGTILLQNAGNVVVPPAPGGEIAGEALSGAPVPEPGTAMLFALGMLAASQVRRRRA